MDNINENNLRKDIRKQLEEKEKKREEKKNKKDIGQLSRIEFIRREKIRQEEEKKFYSEKGYVKIKNKYGDAEWIPANEAIYKKRGKKKKNYKKIRKNFKFFRELVLFFLAMLVLYAVYNYYSKGKVGVVESAILIIQSDVPGAKIFLNGTYTNRITPDTLTNLKSGRYWVVVDKPGFEEIPNFVNVVLKAGDKKILSFNLTSSHMTGEIKVSGLNPPFNYYIDGHYYGKSDQLSIMVPLGKHLIAIEKPGLDVFPKSQWIIVEGQKENRLSVSASPLRSHGSIRVTSDVLDAFIYINQNNSGRYPSLNYWNIEPGTYEVKLVHPDFSFIPEKELIEIKNGEKRNMVFTKKKRSKHQSKFFIHGKNKEQISVDGHIYPALVGYDTIMIVPGEHQIIALNQSNIRLSKSGWIKIMKDSLTTLSWNSGFKSWE